MKSEQKKILVVDDDPDILEVVQLLLEGEGYLTWTATEAKSIDRLLSFQLDLILLDVLLAGSDGRVISKRLKSQETTRHIPIVLMSAHVSARATLAAAQADDFIAKPFEVNALLTTIHKYIWWSQPQKGAHPRRANSLEAGFPSSCEAMTYLVDTDYVAVISKAIARQQALSNTSSIQVIPLRCQSHLVRPGDSLHKFSQLLLLSLSAKLNGDIIKHDDKLETDEQTKRLG
jgi:CheY-like chemotaxis protein